MNHGYQDHNPTGSSSTTTTENSGPRAPAVELGLDATRHFGNILRLLESSHGYTSTMMGVDTLSTVWHARGKCWWYDTTSNEPDDESGGNRSTTSTTTAGGVWRAASPVPLTTTEEEDDDQVMNRILFLKQKQQVALRSSPASVSPRLLSLTFSDHCTALAKVVGVDGVTRYLSLLRLEEDEEGGFGVASGGRPPNDGWLIVQEVMVVKTDSGVLDKADDTDHHHHDHSHHHDHHHNKTTASTISGTSTLYNSLLATLHQYLEIEHGGGAEDVNKAQKLFAAQTALLSVGTEHDKVSKSDWLAPYGTLLEIPLSTYLAGVKSQVPPHTIASKQFDAISTIDMIVTSTNMTTTTHAAAAATVRVGNGAQTRVFEDHLLLGWCNSTHQWNILSKVYSPQAWPSTTH
jgi:hypothetical protein